MQKISVLRLKLQNAFHNNFIKYIIIEKNCILQEKNIHL